MSEALYVDNSNVAEIKHLRNSITDAFDTAATVTLTITDSSNAEITGETWPVTMAHASSGTYRYTLADDIDITAGASYTATVNITGTGGLVGKFVVPVKAVTRIA